MCLTNSPVHSQIISQALGIRKQHSPQNSLEKLHNLTAQSYCPLCLQCSHPDGACTVANCVEGGGQPEGQTAMQQTQERMHAERELLDKSVSQ